MGFYENYCLPHVINCACGMKAIERQRQKVVPLAEGVVLEIGMGSGLNLKYYDSKQVDYVWGLEPSEGMRRKAKSNLIDSPVTVKWLDNLSEDIPLDNDSIDTIVLTYTLCTIPNYQSALAEMRRVLKPSGKMVFSEHGLSPEISVQKWQYRVNSVWKRLAGGCNLDRDIPKLIEAAGFCITNSESGYVKGPKIATYQYWGQASIAN